MSSAITLRNPERLQPQAEAVAQLLPADMANYAFTHVHYPGGWVYDDELGFLPELSEITARPGVNGVPINGNTNLAMAGAIGKGGMIVNPTDPRLGDYRNYMARFKCVGGRHRYGLAQDEYVLLPGGEAKQEDTSAYKRGLLVHLRDNGMVHPLESPVYRKLLDIEERACRRLAERSAANPFFTDALKARQLRLAKMKQAWADLRAKLTPVGTAAPESASEEAASRIAAAGAATPKRVTVKADA